MAKKRHRELWLFLAGLAVPILPALLAQSPGKPEGNRRLSEAEMARCLRSGGHAAIAGLSGVQICVHPLADAGRACTSSSQCIGHCLLDEASLHGRPLQRGQPVRGRCEATDYGYGCRTTVENGRIATSLCVD